MAKFDLGIKQVKDNPESLFEQIVMGSRPQFHVPSFKAIVPLVPEKKIFDGSLPYMVMMPSLFL